MDPVEWLGKQAARSSIGNKIEMIREGWNGYSFFFFVGGVAAILGSLLGIASGLAVVVTLVFFYYAGKFKRHVDAERKKIERERKNKK